MDLRIIKIILDFEDFPVVGFTQVKGLVKAHFYPLVLFAKASPQYQSGLIKKYLPKAVNLKIRVCFFTFSKLPVLFLTTTSTLWPFPGFT